MTVAPRTRGRRLQTFTNPDIKDANHQKKSRSKAAFQQIRGAFEQRCAHHLIFIARRRGLI